MTGAAALRRRPASWPLLALAALWLGACATTRPPAPPAPGEVVELRGLASWYGDEFAGRPTANGEIFNPKQLTAAHRTLPFGTLVDVTYVRTGRATRVRVNDRGPFVGNRIIDLSYAAASEIGMVDDGVGEVEIAVVAVGGGDSEPPKPYNVTIPPAEPEPAAEPAPAVASAQPPLPETRSEPTPPPAPEPVVLAEDLPVAQQQPPAQQSPPAPPRAEPSATAPAAQEVAAPSRNGWFVQLGAFSVEANAVEMKAKVERVTRPVSVQRAGGLYRVRVGPWATRSRAIEEKERLEAAGYAGIVINLQ